MLLITRYYSLLPVTPSYYMFYGEKDYKILVPDPINSYYILDAAYYSLLPLITRYSVVLHV